MSFKALRRVSKCPRWAWKSTWLQLLSIWERLNKKKGERCSSKPPRPKLKKEVIIKEVIKTNWARNKNTKPQIKNRISHRRIKSWIKRNRFRRKFKLRKIPWWTSLPKFRIHIIREHRKLPNRMTTIRKYSSTLTKILDLKQLWNRSSKRYKSLQVIICSSICPNPQQKTSKICHLKLWFQNSNLRTLSHKSSLI